MDVDALTQENERLRRENARLAAALEEARSRSEGPEDVLRAIRHGEIDALVVQEQGREQIYSLLAFDSSYRVVVEECFPYGVWLTEPDGRMLYVSPSFLGLLGTNLAEMRERGAFHFLPFQTRVAAEREWARCRQSHAPFNFEYTVRLPDGSERTVWTHGLRVRTADGLPRWAGVNIDVTEREHIKVELRQQAEALREADRRKDEFLALLGHELRNPLAAIRNGVHLLQTPGVDPDSVKQVKEMLDKQVRHLTRMVDDLLDVSRISSGKIQLRKERVELARALGQAADSVRPLLESQEHRLEVSSPPEGVHVEGDPTRLQQVLVNLLTNAAKYTRPGGEIRLSAAREGGEAVVRVRDTGVGIPAELLPKVFDLFTQAESSLDRSQGGLGIGLTLVKRLVEMHGGRVEAHSDGRDRGSEFVVRLPAL